MDIATGSSKSVSSADKAIGVPRVGVGVVVLNHRDEVLIGKRKSPHGQGTDVLSYSDILQVHGHYLELVLIKSS